MRCTQVPGQGGQVSGQGAQASGQGTQEPGYSMLPSTKEEYRQSTLYDIKMGLCRVVFMVVSMYV